MLCVVLDSRELVFVANLSEPLSANSAVRSI
jgi:hypothetical protein